MTLEILGKWLTICLIGPEHDFLHALLVPHMPFCRKALLSNALSSWLMQLSNDLLVV